MVEKHLQMIGLLKAPELDDARKKLIEEKKAEFEARNKQTDAFAKGHFPEGAQLCGKCSTAAVVLMDGCIVSLPGVNAVLVALSLIAAPLAARAESPLPTSAMLMPSVEPALPMADRVLVQKGERKLQLLRNGEVLRTYKVALGLRPEGHKEYEGDFRTPEGVYKLSRRNPNSEYFLSIQIDYPNDRDVARARKQGVRPGGAIMLAAGSDLTVEAYAAARVAATEGSS